MGKTNPVCGTNGLDLRLEAGTKGLAACGWGLAEPLD